MAKLSPAAVEQIKREAVKLFGETIARKEALADADAALAEATTPGKPTQFTADAARAVAKVLKEDTDVSAELAGSTLAHQLGRTQRLAAHEARKAEGLRKRANAMEAGKAPTARDFSRMTDEEFRADSRDFWMDIWPPRPN